MYITDAVVQPMANAGDVPWHRGSVTSSPSRRYPVGFTAGSAPMYDVSTLRRKSLDRRRKFRVGCHYQTNLLCGFAYSSLYSVVQPCSTLLQNTKIWTKNLLSCSIAVELNAINCL